MNVPLHAVPDAGAALSCCVQVDMICWSVVSGVLHGFAVWRMILDELPVR